jgi:hypothetical protein
MTVATLALGAGSAIAGSAAQASAARQQSVFQNTRYTRTAENAMQAYRDGINQLMVRDSQETAAASREAITASRTVGSQRASARTLVNAAGLSGNSVASLMREFDSLAADNELVIDSNLRMKQDQIGQNMKALRVDAQNRINSAEPQPVSGPSPFALALNLGSAGLQAANTWKAWQPPPSGKIT